MDIYDSEHEQIEALKRWWKDNGTAVIAGLVLGLAGLFGWRTWQGHIRAQSNAASIAYQDMVSKMIERKPEAAASVGTALISKYPDSAYASLAALMVAKVDAERGDLDKAQKRLEWVVAHGDIDEVKTMARIRLGRVLLAAGKPDQAWNAIAPLKSDNSLISLEELKGDILAAQGKKQEARTAYLQALTLGKKVRADSALTEMKLAALGKPTAAETKTTQSK